MGSRIIKTAVAAMIAIWIAEYARLDFALSAGLLAILGVEVTRRKGIRSASVRFAASLVGLLTASFIFWLFGFQIWVVGIFILGVYPILNKVNLRDGIVTCTVIVFHVYTLEQVSLSIIVNEVLLLVIGLGTATCVNMIYMPKQETVLGRLKQETEAHFSTIFREIARNLKDAGYIWSGEELLKAHDAIAEALVWSERISENNLFQERPYWIRYFQMRKRQLESIQRMIGLVAQIYADTEQGQVTAPLFEQLSDDVKVGFYRGKVEAELALLENRFKEMPLPKTREEFEVRSAILQLCLELKYYLSIAKKEKGGTSPAV